MPMMLCDVTDERGNKANQSRIVATGAVVVLHTFPITLRDGTSEPFQRTTGRGLCRITVAVFSAISAFLVTRIFDRKPRLTRWLRARIMQLFPGLPVVFVLNASPLKICSTAWVSNFRRRWSRGIGWVAVLKGHYKLVDLFERWNGVMRRNFGRIGHQ